MQHSVYSPTLPFRAQQAHTYVSPSFWNAFKKALLLPTFFFKKKREKFSMFQFSFETNIKTKIHHRACKTAEISFPDNYCLFMVSLTPC